MPSRQYAITTPWIRSTFALTRIVITLRVNAERHGSGVTWALNVVNIVHEISLLPDNMVEIPDSEDEDEGDFCDDLPCQVQEVCITRPCRCLESDY